MQISGQVSETILVIFKCESPRDKLSNSTSGFCWITSFAFRASSEVYPGAYLHELSILWYTKIFGEIPCVIVPLTMYQSALNLVINNDCN